MAEQVPHDVVITTPDGRSTRIYCSSYEIALKTAVQKQRQYPGATVTIERA